MRQFTREELDINAVFDRYSPFVREFIYKNQWQSLHEVQLIASRVLMDTDYHLLIPSSTASGKTEAAFFPILSELSVDAPESFAVLYVAPLKSLINDQFARIDQLLEETGIPVYHWHGDVAASHKSKALRTPRGVLQITPESLESMLMNRSNDIPRLFGGLRYVVLDEIHTLIGTDRGNQILCQLARIAGLTGHDARRVGLSATIGDTSAAAEWLGGGSDRPVYVPELPPQKLRWRLGMEHFFIQSDDLDQTKNPATGTGEIGAGQKTASAENIVKTAALDPGYEYIYDCAKLKKSLVFSNSREETEYVTATLRQIAEARGEEDVFLIHHGNLSASLREEAERKMKDDEIFAVTCATVTMELGIDIGKLGRVIQMGSPNTVSNFLQRLGRSGRRGDPPEMMMVFREEMPLPNAPLPQMIPWELIKAIAVVQLYVEERFIEPPRKKNMPFSLMFQQTLSVLAAGGAMRAKELARRVMALPPFSAVTEEDYRELLLGMLQNDFLEMTEERELMIGLKGERLINSFKFYAVFKDSEDFTVRCESEEIGTVTTPTPVGDRFALAGRVWEVEELDVPRKLIYVKPVKGKMEISWPGDFGEVHTRILERMRRVLCEDTVYPYLKPNAVKRLQAARNIARNTGMTERNLVHLGGYTWCLFPWLGTRSFRTLRKWIARHGDSFRVSNIEFEGCYYMQFRMERGDGASFLEHLKREAEGGICLAELVGETECPVFDKYDEYVPGKLLREAYCADRLAGEEAEGRVRELR